MTKPDALEKIKQALKDWPVSVHPRLGIGPTFEDIGTWYCKHVNTLRSLLEQASLTARQPEIEGLKEAIANAENPDHFGRLFKDDGDCVLILEAAKRYMEGG